jgi:hypothetical protein
VITNQADTARQVSGYLKSCCVLKVDTDLNDTEALLTRGIAHGMKKGWCAADDAVVCVYGTKEGAAGITYLMRVLKATTPKFARIVRANQPVLSREQLYFLTANLVAALVGIGIGRVLFGSRR